VDDIGVEVDGYDIDFVVSEHGDDTWGF